MSATLNAEQFSNFWWNAPIGVVHGRTYPVTILHTTEQQADYVEAAISTILQIHEKEEPGDVLCFLTGQEEIEDAKLILQQRMKLFPNSVPDFTVLTLYSAMPYEQQLLVFEPTAKGERKIILATNIAETSITVEGIKYVVDSGVVKTKYFNSKTGMEALAEMDISKAQATQRAGRAGRMTAGKCFRLYTADGYESLAENTVPEIRRSSLISVVLQMKSLDVKNVLDFEFMDMPPAKSVIKAEETLMLLQALDKNGVITPLGRRLIDFPIEPTSAMVLLAAKALGVAREALTVVALTNTENLFFTSKESKEGADKCKATFAKSSGDHITLLSIYQAYKRTPEKDRKRWCEANCISHRQMLKAEDVITQLYAILAQEDDTALLESLIPLSARFGQTADHGGKRGRGDEEEHKPHKSSHYDLLRRALCYGYYLQTAFFNAKLQLYQTIVGHLVVHIHPSSVLFTHRRKPALVLFSSVVRTTKQYMKDVSVIHEEWLKEATPHFLLPAD
ncbi:RNA helicase [Angomonas deanei]|uniref:RNA helicase n=1 Tax=Angomonas deanei TaxID=59799 RepID=A0A7G2C5G5_9TRYP|nr:RNA helicase [Angomonas deanei]CAD2213172.1 Helicase conserved C-terminal domain/Helicase associated domain (HA2)/Oligonucleotide/oligosaccharide-binding (OB)-fold, putative [Angomonas deanei]|eukprot:EPY25774.1 RNA helicase [Angomonas deanei]